MSYMRSTDSAVLQEFGRIMQEKDELKKVAQTAAPLSDDEKEKLRHTLAGLAAAPSNGPAMERWISRLRGQIEPYLKQVHDALAERYRLWSAGKSAAEIAAVPLPASPTKVAQVKGPASPADAAFEAYTNKLIELQVRAQKPNPNHDPALMISRRELEHLAQLGRAVNPDIAKQATGPLLEYDAGRDPKPVLLGMKTHEEASMPHRTVASATLSIHEKVAEQKSYDVTGKEDIVHEAHPQTAKVNGEVVENLNEQQRADLAVAEKSAKNILVALYKLAKRLRSEKNTKAYSLVKECFLELSKSLKK